MPERCSVVGCSEARGEDDGVRFFVFPKRNLEQRELWVKAIKRQSAHGDLWQPYNAAVVCSKHFLGGQPNPTRTHPDYAPSIFPTSHRRQGTTSSLDRHNRQMKRREEKSDVGNQQGNVAKLVKDFSQQVNCIDFDPLPSEKSNFPIFSFERISETEVSTLARIPLKKDASVGTDQQLRKVNNGSQTDPIEKPFSTESLRNEEEWKSWTGITSHLFDCIHCFLESKLKSFSAISTSSKLLIFLIKLKTNLSFSAIGSLFQVHRSTISQIFHSVLEAAYSDFKKLLIWPEKSIIQSRMPQSFKEDFPNCRVVIDASEIECEKPAAVKNQILLYSNYKSAFTVKFLIGVAPSCEVIFLSKCYGGRTTDAQIVTESGFVKLLEQDDVVLADKGFPRIISSVERQGAFVVMPPFKRGENQFSSDENLEGYKCAKVRIHVERVIGRMKTFQILQFLSSNLLPSIDKILVVIAFLHNNMPDLIRE